MDLTRLNEVLKYKRERLTVDQMHPELRFTRLGAVLREHATEPSDVGELAYQALTSPHDQPLELMPLHLLRDKMQEEPGHPLAGKFNWEKLPEKVGMDRAFIDSVGGHSQESAIVSKKRLEELPNSVKGKVQSLLKAFPGMSYEDVQQTAKRVGHKSFRLSFNTARRADGTSSEYAEKWHDSGLEDKWFTDTSERY
jgi:hypothetical protein